jgi:hypothetical protein
VRMECRSEVLASDRAAGNANRNGGSRRPLVAGVHAEARHYERGYSVILIGHGGHEEVEGPMGEAPDATLLIESVEDAESVAPRRTDCLAYLTQTTLSIDETAIIARSCGGGSPRSRRRDRKTSVTRRRTVSAPLRECLTKSRSSVRRGSAGWC